MKLFPGASLFRLRPLIVFGGLLLISAFAYRASPRQMLLLLVLAIGAGFVLAFMRWPSFGLVIASVAGLVVPYLGPSGLNATMVMVGLLLGLWLMDMFIGQHQIRLVSSRPVWPFLCFVIAGLISFGVGQLPWFAFALHAPMGAQLGGLSIIVLSAGAFLLMANQLNEVRWLSRLLWVFLAVGAFTVLVRSVLPELGFDTREYLLPVGTVFYIWLAVMAFSQAAFNKDLHPGWRWALGVLLAITIYNLFVLKFDDKSGWLSAFAAIGVAIGIRSWRAGLALVPVVVIAMVYMWSGLVATDEYSITTRFDAWIILGQIIKINPLWGLGFANYYWYTPLFPIRGYAVSFNSHNNYVDRVCRERDHRRLNPHVHRHRAR